MKNIDKIRQMSAEELVMKVLQQSGCIFCAYNDGNCQTKDCNIGQTEWLNQEDNPMPELKVGYIISSYYPTIDKTVNYVYLGNSVLWCDKNESFVKFENNMKKFIKAIYRKDVDGFTKVELWRADDE